WSRASHQLFQWLPSILCAQCQSSVVQGTATDRRTEQAPSPNQTVGIISKAKSELSEEATTPSATQLPNSPGEQGIELEHIFKSSP
ncbi:MAG TPA: hypothetical protein VKS98_09920, partial [Chthoniobacterales bacterium]|nr:hypothetical protein [Chthoniobacterales bacterium]